MLTFVIGWARSQDLLLAENPLASPASSAPPTVQDRNNLWTAPKLPSSEPQPGIWKSNPFDIGPSGEIANSLLPPDGNPGGGAWTQLGNISESLAIGASPQPWSSVVGSSRPNKLDYEQQKPNGSNTSLPIECGSAAALLPNGSDGGNNKRRPLCKCDGMSIVTSRYNYFENGLGIFCILPFLFQMSCLRRGHL